MLQSEWEIRRARGAKLPNPRQKYLKHFVHGENNETIKLSQAGH